MNVYVLDERLSGTNTQIALERLRAHGYVAFSVNGDWSVHRICSRVRQLAGQVGVLYIHCHGSSGELHLGQGLRSPGDARDFGLLLGCWTGRYPRIELHACAVASATPVVCDTAYQHIAHPTDLDITEHCTPGTLPDQSSPSRELIQAIADYAGVLVVAPVNVQHGGHFDGPLLYCRPNVMDFSGQP